jgi:hypothetical protein
MGERENDQGGKENEDEKKRKQAGSSQSPGRDKHLIHGDTNEIKEGGSNPDRK